MIERLAARGITAGEGLYLGGPPSTRSASIEHHGYLFQITEESSTTVLVGLYPDSEGSDAVGYFEGSDDVAADVIASILAMEPGPEWLSWAGDYLDAADAAEPDQ